MKEPREEAWTYHVKFSVGTAHYETTVQAHGKDMVRKQLEMQYPNCKVVVRDEDITMERKEYIRVNQQEDDSGDSPKPGSKPKKVRVIEMGVKEPKEPIWVYDVKFSVDTIGTKEIVKVYGEDMIPKLLQKKYPNCKITIHEIKEMGREK